MKNVSNNPDTPITEKVRESLELWTETLYKLEAKAKKKEVSARESMYELIQSLKKKKDSLEEDWKSLREAGDQASTDIREGLRGSYDIASKSFKNAESRFL